MAQMQADGWDIFDASDWVVTYHFALLGSWGTSHQEITLNVPMLQGNYDATEEFGKLLWQIIVARATAMTTLLTGIFYKLGGQLGGWQPIPIAPTMGGLFGHQGDRNGSAVITFDHGFPGKWGSRPFFFPGFPARLSEGGIVTDEGLQGLERIGHILAMGACTTNDLGTMLLYNRWPVIGPSGEEQPGLYAFRRVEFFRVMQHTGRAPDYRIPI